MKKISLSLVLALASAMSLTAGNLIPGDSSFETGYGVWGKTGSIDASTAQDGAQSLKIDMRLTSNATFSFTPGKRYFFSVYLKAEKADTPVTLQAYRTNWMGNDITKQVKAGTSWTRFTLEIPPQTIDTHNQVWLVLDPQGQSVWVDACQFEQDALTDYEAAVPLTVTCDLQSPVFGNLFHPGERIVINLDFYNCTGGETKFTGFARVTDYDGNKVFDWSEQQLLSGKKSLRVSRSLPAEMRKGFFHVAYGVIPESGDRLSDEASFSVVAPPLPFSWEEGSLFGICGGPDERIPACGRMGVKWFAVPIRWSYEKAPGQLAEGMMAKISSTIDKLRENGIQPNCYLRRTPDWAAVKTHPHGVYPPEQKYLPNYEDFAFRVVSRFKDKVNVWQLWGGETDLLRDHVANELGKNEEWFIDILTEMYKAGYRGAKKADPSCVVGTGSVSGVDCEGAKFPFDRKVLPKVKGSYDEFVIHPYCYPSRFGKDVYVQSPEEHKLAQIYHAAHEISGTDVCNGEYGFAIAPTEALDSQASKRMADYMVRSYLLTATVPSVKRLMWYTIAGDYDAFNIWKGANPRPLVAAYAALAQVLTGCSDPKAIPMGSYIEAYSFTRKNGSVAALWVPENKQIKIELPTVKDSRIVDIMGNEMNPGKELILSGSPVYLLADGMPAAALNKMLGESKIFLDPAKAEIRIRTANTITVYLTNQLNKEVDGKVVIDVPLKGKGLQAAEKAFTKLRPGIPEAVTLSLPDALDLAKLNGNVMTGKLETIEGTVALSQKLELIECRRMAGGVKVDGNPDEWSGRPCLELKTINYLYPPDAAAPGLWQGEGDLSVKAYVGWDENYFYFAAAVTDDIYRADQEVMKLWSGDCVQIAFDCLNESLTPGLKENDREYTIGHSSKADSAAVLQDWPIPPSVVDCPVVVRRDGKQIFYEAAIPFKLLNPLRPASGKVFGFNFVALDQDSQKVDYWLGLTYGICGGKNTAIFKKFILTE